MKVIAFASQKGGCGKTTLAGHLAVQAARAGAGSVGLIDTDPQGTLADWHGARKDDTLRFARATPQRLAKEVDAMRAAGVALLIIDTPPAISSNIARVIGLSDLVVIPTRPSPHDLRAVGATASLAQGLETAMMFVINGAAPKARITVDAVIALSQHGPVAPTVIHQRVGFAASMTDGRTVMEIPSRSQSPAEVVALWDFAKQRLGLSGAVKRAAAKARRDRLRKKQPVARRIVGKSLSKRTRKKPLVKNRMPAKPTAKRPAKKSAARARIKKAA